MVAPQFGRMSLAFGRTGFYSAKVPRIAISAASLAEQSADSTPIGTLSVTDGDGVYDFTLTDNAGGRAKLVGAHGASLQAGPTMAQFHEGSSFNIGVSATNGDAPLNQIIAITVVQVHAFVLREDGSFVLREDGSRVEREMA